ncbi:MAG: peroxiredoxin [Trueperaceae bacterium]|nr:peroxiredoxin [Trueperaceae bacterium]
MPIIGEKAPGFSLSSSIDKTISLSDYKGNKPVVLVFYPLDFSPVCSVQLPEYSSRKADFERAGAEILGINRDSVYTHKAWAQEFGIDLPLLADMTGEVARAYGVYLDERGISGRAVFIIDKEGILRYQHIEKETRDFTFHADDILKELAKL